MNLLAIDPGPSESAYVLWKDGQILKYGKQPNDEVRFLFRHGLCIDKAVCERMRCYGMVAGAEMLETCEWSGRFQQTALDAMIEWHWLERMKVKLHLCHDSRAKDANIRQALIDRFGGKEKAIGRKKSPGTLYGISGDEWAALAVAITFVETQS